MRIHHTRTPLSLLLAGALSVLGGCAGDHAARSDRVAESTPLLYEGFGGYKREVTTDSAEAQRWFDQGIQLLYGFNHDEAIRSFRAAAEADPDCAMAWWGVAYALGLHINNPQMGQSSRAWLTRRPRRRWRGSRRRPDRAGAHPRRRAALRHARARRPAPPRRGVRRGDGPGLSPVSDRPGRRRALRRVAHEPPALGHVDPRGRAQAPYHRDRRGARAHHGAGPQPPRRQPLLHPRHRGLALARAGDGGGRTTTEPGARLRPPRAYAQPHLHPHGPVRRRGERQ
jgi:hypothetical protein